MFFRKRKNFVAETAKKLGIPEEVLRAEMAKVKFNDLSKFDQFMMWLMNSLLPHEPNTQKEQTK